MARPTDSARDLLMAAAYKLALRKGHVKDPAIADLLEAVRLIAVGLNDISVGLRATYMLLEETKAKIKP